MIVARTQTGKEIARNKVSRMDGRPNKYPSSYAACNATAGGG